ncbi:MAG: M56 family metallopeptidase [Planctomycetota bacterium]|nr:M56 family metallopeptidase [Planctomycetota bacterium]
MTPLDLLLTAARVSVLGIAAIALGCVLLRRRPVALPGMALAAILCSGALLTLTGNDWLANWQNEVVIATHVDRAEVPTSSDELVPQDSPAPNVEASTGVSVPALAAALGKLDDVSDQTAATQRDYVVWLLMGVAGLAMARLLIGLLATIRLHRESRVLSDERLVELTRELAGPGHEMALRVSDRIDAPCVSALSRRCIYLPASWPALSDAELAASIAHELGHLHRHDAAFRLAAQVATALQVFNPFSHGLLRQLVLGQELAADRWAAEKVGSRRYVQGISQLALRLDAADSIKTRRPMGFGMSHSSSFLIRRIKMLRKGMLDQPSQNGVVAQGMAVLSVVAVSLIAASWAVSADEPIDKKTSDENSATTAVVEQPWESYPGASGYWHVNFRALSQHAVAGQWLKQADTWLLTPGWMMVTADRARDQRTALGLSVDNFSNASGSLVFRNTRLHDPAKKETTQSTVSANLGVLSFQRGVDWNAISNAFDKKRFNAAILGLASKTFPAESTKKIVEQDPIAQFFAVQADSRQFHMPQEERTETKPTPSVVPVLWKRHHGQLATLLSQLTNLEEQPEEPHMKLLTSLHNSSEYYVIGIDPSETPDNVIVRMALSPRGDMTVDELAKLIEQAKDALVSQVDPKLLSDELIDIPVERPELPLLKALKHAKPRVHKSTEPGLKGSVEIQADVSLAAIRKFITI